MGGEPPINGSAGQAPADGQHPSRVSRAAWIRASPVSERRPVTASESRAQPAPRDPKPSPGATATRCSSKLSGVALAASPTRIGTGPTSSAGYLLGPLAGGLLLGLGVSTPVLFAADAATFLVSALFVASLRRSFGVGGGTESHPGVLAGVRLILREPVLRLLVAASMTSLLGIGIVNVAAYPLSLRLGGGTEGYGAMEALLGGGGLVGAALAARLLTTGRARAIVTFSFAISGAGLALAAGAPVLIVALAGMAVAGAGRGLGDVADTTLVQARTADAVRSRVFAAQEGASHVAFSAAMLAGGVLVGVGGARLGVGVAAGCALLAALIASRMLKAPS